MQISRQKLGGTQKNKKNNTAIPGGSHVSARSERFLFLNYYFFVILFVFYFTRLSTETV